MSKLQTLVDARKAKAQIMPDLLNKTSDLQLVQLQAESRIDILLKATSILELGTLIKQGLGSMDSLKEEISEMRKLFVILTSKGVPNLWNPDHSISTEAI